MNCPSCHASMTAKSLDGHHGTRIAIDICVPCQLFWFDARESLQLAPGAVLNLFQLVGDHSDHAASGRTPMAGQVACPRCRQTLLLTNDRQRNTPFQYRRCPAGHGRLITFVEFLREKDFVRPLSSSQLEDLRRNVKSVNCSNCGAPIDLAKSAACTHCGSPLSMLDMKRAGALVVELRDADERVRTIDPALPLELERARREVEAAFASFERGPRWFTDVSNVGLVGAGVSSLARWLKSKA